MNIRVDLNYPLKDGTEVVFRSPVDCSQVTGLKIYHPDGSQEFVLADAHGNNVGDIDHLFAANVAVKVILDVTTGMAFVQNADTNAYLEEQLAKKAPLSHTTDKENPHKVTYGQVGAAPAGFGCGEKAARAQDWDGHYRNGFYKEKASSPDGVNLWYGLTCVSYNGELVNVAFNPSEDGAVMALRHIQKNKIGEWEYVNPPMIPGVEYRTTERWNGEPVSKMLDADGKLWCRVGDGDAQLYSVLLGDQTKESLPTYWQSHLDSKVALIREAMLTAGANKSAFFFYSDSHWSNDTTYTAKKAPALLKYLCKNTPINKTNFGGDIVSAEATDAETMAYLWEWREQLYGLPNHHSVPGNHDDGNSTNNLFSEKYVYGYLLAPDETADIVRGDEGMYYYIDNPAEKTRYLYLDTAYKGVTEGELDFVKAALLSTQENWHIVAIAHWWYAVNYGVYPPVINGFEDDAKKLLYMFDSFNARQGVFSDCTAWVEFCIGGHYHLDYVEHTNGGIPVIVVEADTLHDRSGTMPQAGTTDEAAISAVIADYSTKTVKVIRVGRGADYDTTIEVKTVSYTNVIPLSIDKDGSILNDGKGWADSSRIGSGGIYVGNGSYYVTGHIPIDRTIELTIRFKNVTFGTNSAVAFFDSSFARITNGNSDWLQTAGLKDYYHAVVDDSGNITEFTMKPGHMTNEALVYMAIQADYLGDDSIITINEPID